MVKRNGKNREHLTVLNVPHLRKKIKKTCANRPVSCVNGEDWTDFGSPKGRGFCIPQSLPSLSKALPLGELAPKVTERARTLTEKSRRSDSIALPKNLLIAAWRLSGDGLALSVIACAMPPLPKGEAFRRRGFCFSGVDMVYWERKKPPTGREKGEWYHENEIWHRGLRLPREYCG